MSSGMHDVARRLSWLPARLGAALLSRGARAAARMPDAVLARALQAAELAVEALDANHGALGPIREVREILADDPEGREVLRRLFLDGRESQLRAFFEGVLRHHVVTASPDEAPAPDAPAAVTVVGQGIEAELVAAGWEESGLAVPAVLGPRPHVDRSDVAGLAVLEVTQPGCVDEALLTAALRDGVALSLAPAVVPDSATLRRLADAARRARTPLRILWPHRYYAPFRQLVRLVREGELGELQAVRVRATVGGSGGALPAEPVPRTDYLSHPAFDLLPLIVELMGPVAGLGAYLNPMWSRRGGQGLVTCKAAAPGQYALLECCLAPEMTLRSAHWPYDLAIEVAGSHGVAWMQRGMAERLHAPPIRVRVGREDRSYGIESGLSGDWEPTYARAASEMLRVLESRSDVWLKELDDALKAVEARETAQRAASAGRVVPVAGH